MRKQFVTIFWGNKYDTEYVNRLYAMVASNVSPPFDLYCVTDNTKNIRPEIICIPLPELGCEEPVNTLGIWGKSRLWLRELGGLSGPVLFMDLDVIVNGNLDAFFEFGEEEDVILSHNPNTPFEKLGQTSIFRFPIGKLAPLREMFLADPQGIADKYRFEQRFVTQNTPGGIKFWPKGWVSHFKYHCVPTFPLNYFFRPRLPHGSKVIIFPGPLNPPDAIVGRWREEYAVQGRLAHIWTAFFGNRCESLPEHIRHYVLPTPWVARLWKK